MAAPVLSAVRQRASLPGVPAGLRGPQRFARTPSFGSVLAVVTAISTGVNLTRAAADLAPKLKSLFKKERSDTERWEKRMIRAQRQMKGAKTKFDRRRARARFLRYREKWHLSKIRQGLIAEQVATGGPALEGTAREIRRNMLVNEWDTASSVGKVEIEQLIGKYDKSIDRFYREWRGSRGEAVDSPAPELASPTALAPAPPAPQAPQGSKAVAPLGIPSASADMPTLHKGPILSAKSPVETNQALVTGLGGLGFTSTSPNPPGNLARVSFFPVQPSQSYSGSTGILVPGDDPVLLMTLTASAAGDFVLSSDYVVETEIFDYGRYRVLGLQANHQSNFLVKTSAGANRTTAEVKGCALTVRSLEVYNGEQLLLPLGELDVRTFDIFGSRDGGYPGISATSLSAHHQQAPYNYRSRSKGFFVGLRTNPVIGDSAKIRMVVRAFTYVQSNDTGTAATGFLADDTMEVPVSFNLVADILEDKVFGDPLVPSPASRAGAQVRLGVRELGMTTSGVQQIQMVNPGYKPPLLRGPDDR